MDSEDEEVDVEAMYQPNKRVKTGSVGGAITDSATSDGALAECAPGIS